MEYFPIGFTKFFENIVDIHAGMNKLSHLEREDLKEFSKIRFLYLYTNQLKVLESDVFQYNTALEYISFYNNRLMHIGSKILQPLKRLRTAYFNKNICVDKQAVGSQEGISELRLEIAQQLTIL
jgi:Leucine-rich repeat (LRR) protein